MPPLRYNGRIPLLGLFVSNVEHEIASTLHVTSFASDEMKFQLNHVRSSRTIRLYPVVINFCINITQVACSLACFAFLVCLLLHLSRLGVTIKGVMSCSSQKEKDQI